MLTEQTRNEIIATLSGRVGSLTSDEMLGRYLDDIAHTSRLTTEDILNATSLEALQDKARKADRFRELYIRWNKEMKL